MEDIKKKVKQLPDSCGVYLIKDVTEKTVYVGKAISIKKRLLSHLRSRLADKIADVDYILTSSELSALILEAKLIKQYKPKYNVMMRDDKSYPYVKLTSNEDFPRLIISRKVEDDGAQYYGPFTSESAREIIRLIGRLFPVRRCKTTPLKKKKLPCLNYHMHRCLAPCKGNISKNEYGKIILSIKQFFENGIDETIKGLKVQMVKASDAGNFEEAAKFRDRTRRIEMACSKRSTFNTGRVRAAGGLEELSKIAGTSKIPKRIEAFDISNIGPSQTVGAMAVFVNGKPFKKHYRKFIISGAAMPNDTASIYETVYRRFAKSLSRELPVPDLILVDGGKGQLSSVEKALRDAGVDIPAIGLAKKNEEIFLKNMKEPLRLPPDAPALLFLKQVRDEVHRFAVSFHRQRRKKEMFFDSSSSN